jgi:hypothetical protein
MGEAPGFAVGADDLPDKVEDVGRRSEPFAPIGAAAGELSVPLRLKCTIARLDGQQVRAGRVGTHPSLDVHAVADLEALTDAQVVDEAFAVLAKRGLLCFVPFVFGSPLCCTDGPLGRLLLEELLHPVVVCLVTNNSYGHIHRVSAAEHPVPSGQPLPIAGVDGVHGLATVRPGAAINVGCCFVELILERAERLGVGKC